MAGSDLFAWLDAIWTKKKLEGTPPTFMLHRFLASKRELAEAARVLQREVREPDLVYATWQGLTGRGPGAPRLRYVAPKKGPKAEELVVRMCDVLGERREIVEEMIEMVGDATPLYKEYGVEPPKEDE